MSDLAEYLGYLGQYANRSWGCHGIVTRDGLEDACDKPATSIIDGRGTEAEWFWPACAYHAHRYGYGRVVPLIDIVKAVQSCQ